MNIISENITPIGDGNSIISTLFLSFKIFISENITPIGDGNLKPHCLSILDLV